MADVRLCAFSMFWIEMLKNVKMFCHVVDYAYFCIVIKRDNITQTN